MNLRILAPLCAAFLFAHIASAQTADNRAILGVWRAQMNGIPAFTLVLSDEGGSLQGAVLFDLMILDNHGQPATSTPGVPEPLLHPRFDGQLLKFEVSHRRSHPPGTLKDPPVPFALKPIDLNKAEVINLNEKNTMVVTRTEY